MQAPRLSGLAALLRQPVAYAFRSPPARLIPLVHTRHVRNRTGRRRPIGGPLDVQGRSRAPEGEEEEDPNLDDIDEADFQRWLAEQQAQNPAKRRKVIDASEYQRQREQEDQDEGDSPEDEAMFDEEELQRLLEEQQVEEHTARQQRQGNAAQSRGRHDDGRYNEDGDINFYEQDEGDPESRMKGAGDPDSALQKMFSAEDLRALEDESGQAEDELQELDEEDQEMGLQQTPTPLDPELRNRQFTEEQKGQLQKAFFEGIETLESSGKIDSGQFPHHVEIDEEMPDSALLFLQKFNESLDRTALDVEMTGIEENNQNDLWRRYERSKIYVPNFLQSLPDAAWQLLWITQSEETPSNPQKDDRLQTLSRDMATAGKSLTEEQRFAQLEGLYMSGKQAEALQQWEEGLKKGDAGKAAYLELGVRMYAYDSNLQRAEELVDVLFKLHTNYDPRILLQVISASIGLKTDEGHERAWKLYQRLREVLTSNITMEDFDTISTDFLRFDQKDYALAVFRDMMMIGEQRKSQSNPQNTLKRLSQFISSSQNATEVNILGLESLKYLPRQFQNKWFYASWMRKLIAMGENQPAAKVMELMYERGINPDAKHINGLINGYLRTSSRPSHTHAEKMAWSMIQTRLNLVAERHASLDKTLNAPPPSQSIHDISSSLITPNDKPVVPSLDKNRRIPPATIETFSLMAQWYLRRQAFATVAHLRDLLVYAELPMNSFFMNHLLYAEVRNRSHRDVWSRFESMSQTVRPDAETWKCLWACAKRHVDPAVNRDPRGFPRPRELMRMMRTWFSGLRGQEKRDALGDMDIDGYQDIIRAFCLSRDVVGSLVALKALREMFGLTPEPRTMRMLVMQVARLGLYKPRTHFEARRLTAKDRTDANMHQTTQVLELLVNYRAEGYKEEGLTLEELGEDERKEEQHRVALQLLYTVIKQMKRPEGDEDFDVTPLVHEAARDMGVEVFDVEECMSLVV